MIHDDVARRGKEAEMVERYLTLEGRNLDLTTLTAPERAYLDRCMRAYEERMPWSTYSQFVEGTANPLLVGTGGRVTQAVLEHPLFQAVRDLEDRLGVGQGWLLPDATDDATSHPYPIHRQATRVAAVERPGC
jgi:hypothetical protein